MPVLIHGKEYKTVAERVSEIHQDFESISIVTDMIYNEGDIVVMRTVLKTPKGTFTGIASEDKTNGHINDKSHIEIAETSSVGRSLSFAGYLGSEIASANELENVGLRANLSPVPQKNDLNPNSNGVRQPANSDASPERNSSTAGPPSFTAEPDAEVDIEKLLDTIPPVGYAVKDKMTYRDCQRRLEKDIVYWGSKNKLNKDQSTHLQNLRTIKLHLALNNTGVIG